jgi:hypothetical protein
MEMLKRMDIDVYSTRLDKYYSYPGISEASAMPESILYLRKIVLLRVPRSGSER